MAPTKKKEEQEEIIAAVRRHPCLYNKKDKLFRNGPAKKEIWNKIAKELKIKNGEYK